jgi:hypothetical protein
VIHDEDALWEEPCGQIGGGLACLSEGKNREKTSLLFSSLLAELSLAQASRSVGRQTCCGASGCVEQAADVACAVALLLPAAEAQSAEPTEAMKEDAMDDATLLAAPYIERITARANVIRLLNHPKVAHIFVGRVEREEAIHVDDPDDPGSDAIMTICHLRVVRPIKGVLNGETLDVYYEGGYIHEGDYRYWVHSPRCDYDDLQLVTTFHEKNGMLRASFGATYSLIGVADEATIESLPLVVDVAAAAARAGREQ